MKRQTESRQGVCTYVVDGVEELGGWGLTALDKQAESQAESEGCRRCKYYRGSEGVGATHVSMQAKGRLGQTWVRC